MRIFLSAYHYSLAFFGAVLYGFPSKRISVVGITGTKGKSSVVELLGAILRNAGVRAATVSSVQITIGEHSELNRTGNTMPGRCFLQRFLRRAVRSGCRYAILEITSQGVLQHRHRFISFDAAAFLNIHPEHIEAHGSFERYRRAKTSFFAYVARHARHRAPHFFVNRDDSASERFVCATGGTGRIIRFSRDEFVQVSGIRQETLSGWFLAKFNFENAAAAAAIANVLGIKQEIIIQTFKFFKGIPGRFEVVSEVPFRIVVDYAHTPDSLEQVYKFLSPVSGVRSRQAKRLICVLGSAGGGRDCWKRPVFGKIAAEYCDEAIFTNEDPYDENPEHIINGIAVGFSEAINQKPKIKNALKIVDRKKAITTAISLAKPGDTVVITGKGSEQWMHLARGEKVPWSDKDAAEKALCELKCKTL